MEERLMKILRELASEFPPRVIISALNCNDGVMLGDLGMAIYKKDRDVLDYIKSADQHRLDGGKIVNALIKIEIENVRNTELKNIKVKIQD